MSMAKRLNTLSRRLRLASDVDVCPVTFEAGCDTLDARLAVARPVCNVTIG